MTHRISKLDLKKAMEEVDELFAAGDINGDGAVSKIEFLEFLREHKPKSACDVLAHRCVPSVQCMRCGRSVVGGGSVRGSGNGTADRLALSCDDVGAIRSTWHARKAFLCC